LITSPDQLKAKVRNISGGSNEIAKEIIVAPSERKSEGHSVVK